MDELKELDRKIRRIRLHMIKLTVIWYGVQILFATSWVISAVVFVDPIVASLLGHEKLLGLSPVWWWLSVFNLISQYRIYRAAHARGATGSINKPDSSESENDD